MARMTSTNKVRRSHHAGYRIRIPTEGTNQIADSIPAVNMIGLVGENKKNEIPRLSGGMSLTLTGYRVFDTGTIRPVKLIWIHNSHIDVDLP